MIHGLFRAWRYRAALAWGLISLFALAGCGGEIPPLPRLAQDDVILAFGDSLTHGTGASPETAYPAHLARLVGRRVVNAGVPGETTGDGLARLSSTLDSTQPRLLLLCLGGNDMLRKQDAGETRANLQAMLQQARERGVATVLIGVPEPALFSGAPAFYAELAEEFDIPYEGEVFNEVLKDRRLKADPIHANGEGYRVVAARLAELLRDAGAI